MQFLREFSIRLFITDLMDLPREVYPWLIITMLGLVLYCYAVYRFAVYDDFLIFSVLAFWLTVYAWYRGMLILEGMAPPYIPPRPYKPTPLPLPRGGNFFGGG